MFLIMGINNGMKQTGFDQLIVCPVCGKYGHLHVYMTYTYLMFFFIPVFKWDRHYYARMECCGAQAELDPDFGKAVARGEVTYIDVTRLRFSGTGNSGSRGGFGNTGYAGVKRCKYCGFTTAEDFEYCPKCGRRFE